MGLQLSPCATFTIYGTSGCRTFQILTSRLKAGGPRRRRRRRNIGL